MTPKIDASVIPITQVLYKGKSGKEVISLQKILAQESLYTKTDTEKEGYFGSSTEKSLKAFQCRYSIACSLPQSKAGWGFTGLKTREVLNAISDKADTYLSVTSTSSLPALSSFPRSIYKGMSGDDVALLQKYLTRFSFGVITDTPGYYGLSTEKAVHSFQAKYNIVTGKTTASGYGVFGNKTKILFVKIYGN